MNNPFILLGIAFGLLVIFYFLFRRAPAPGPDENGKTLEEDVFTFDPQRDLLKPVCRRKVTVTAPVQTIAGVKHRLRVEARDLPNLPDIQVPDGKGIDALLVLVIDDRVLLDDSDQEVYDFEQPLVYTIEYTNEDADAAPKNDDGTPKLSIVTGYLAEDGWKFAQLGTTLEANPSTGGGTLTARQWTMHPKDPKWIGIP